MLSNLIMREMICVKAQITELALCVIDENEQIRRDTKKFCVQLSQKCNGLYNIVPDILSRLIDPQLVEEKGEEDGEVDPDAGCGRGDPLLFLILMGRINFNK